MNDESMAHSLVSRDPADLPRCPMERLADRFVDCPKPKWLSCHANRTQLGNCMVYLEAELNSFDQIEDLINYLARVKG